MLNRFASNRRIFGYADPHCVVLPQPVDAALEEHCPTLKVPAANRDDATVLERKVPALTRIRKEGGRAFYGSGLPFGAT